jgi:hypothetical protein
VLSGNEEYKELGADYLNNKLASKRKSYLKKELEKLGYKVILTSAPMEAAEKTA